MPGCGNPQLYIISIATRFIFQPHCLGPTTLVVRDGNATLFSAAGAHPSKASPSSTAPLMLPTRHRKIQDAVAISRVFDFKAGALRSLPFNHHRTGSRRNEDKRPQRSAAWRLLQIHAIPALAAANAILVRLHVTLRVNRIEACGFFFFFVKH